MCSVGKPAIRFVAFGDSPHLYQQIKETAGEGALLFMAKK